MREEMCVSLTCKTIVNILFVNSQEGIWPVYKCPVWCRSTCRISSVITKDYWRSAEYCNHRGGGERGSLEAIWISLFTFQRNSSPAEGLCFPATHDWPNCSVIKKPTAVTPLACQCHGSAQGFTKFSLSFCIKLIRNLQVILCYL